MPCGIFHKNYRTDERIFKTTWVKSWLVALGLFLLLLPLFAKSYILYISNMISIYIIGAIGLNILTGFTGQISIGHGAFVAIGAYTSAILATKLGLPFWIALPCAGLSGAFVGMIFGIPSLRIKGLYLAIATLAAQFIIDYTTIHWEGLTNGITGMSVSPPAYSDLLSITTKSAIIFFLDLLLPQLYLEEIFSEPELEGHLLLSEIEIFPQKLLVWTFLNISSWPLALAPFMLRLLGVCGDIIRALLPLSTSQLPYQLIIWRWLSLAA